MDLETAHAIVRMLADGLDPATGAALAPRDACRGTLARTALWAAVRALEPDAALPGQPPTSPSRATGA